jgi:hypothetical protein
MFKSVYKQTIVFSIAMLSLPAVSLAGGGQVNSRTFMPSSSVNKVMHMKMQAMTMDDEMKDKLFGDGRVSIGKKEEGCKLSIGNQTGNSLSTQPQDIYIDGPVINYCR